MNVHDLIKSVIGEEVEAILAELTREDSKQSIKSDDWAGELFNPGGSGQPTSRLVYKVSKGGEKTGDEVYGNTDGWFLSSGSNVSGPFGSPEEALSKLGEKDVE